MLKVIKILLVNLLLIFISFFLSHCSKNPAQPIDEFTVIPDKPFHFIAEPLDSSICLTWIRADSINADFCIDRSIEGSEYKQLAYLKGNHKYIWKFADSLAPRAKTLRYRISAKNSASQFSSDPVESDYVMIISVKPLAPAKYAHIGHPTVLLQNGKLLVIRGGYWGDENPDYTSCEIYDPSSNTWSMAGSMIKPRSLKIIATLLSNGNVLVTGGCYSDPHFNDCEIYDVNLNKWISAAPMLSKRANHSAVKLLDGKVLVIGGETSNTINTNKCEIYDPQKDTWREAAPLNTARSEHGTVLLPDGRVMVIGGYNSLTSCEIYDPVHDSWQVVAPLFDYKGILRNIDLLDDGHILVPVIESGFVGVGFSEMYDIAKDNWTKVPSLPTVCENYTAAKIDNGREMIIGGNRNNDNYKNYCLIYDNRINNWIKVNPLLNNREGHTATKLPDGRIVIIGGLSTNEGDDEAINIAEVIEFK